MKNIVIQDKGNSEFKLTVTPTEVRIKLKDGAPADMIDEAIEFFVGVANSPEMLACTQSWRGRIRVKDGIFVPKIKMETGRNGNSKENRQGISFG